MKKSDFYTFSNLLSFTRIFIAIPLYILIKQSETTLLLVVIFIAILTDFLDGYFARKLNQITELGKVLDPFADKVCTTTAFVALTLYQDFPPWFTLIIILRDVFILIGSLFIFNKAKHIPASNVPGKITVFFISVLAIVHILQWQFLYMAATVLALMALIISATNYLMVFFNNMKMEHNESA